MTTQKLEISVGLFVLVGIAALLYLAVSIGGGRAVEPDTHIYNARFTNAGGLKTGSPVSIAGVQVGDVRKVALKPDDMAALVTFRVNANIKLADDTVASIHSSGLIGEKFLTLKPGSSGVELKPSAVIVDTESSIDLEDIIARFAFGSVDKK